MTTDLEQTTHRLGEIRRGLEAAENSGDANAIASLFANDAVLIVPDFPVQEGKAACSAFVKELLPGLLAVFDRHVTYTSTDVRRIGDRALDRGTFFFTVRPKSGGTTERVTGKYVWLYEPTAEGDWACSHMMVSRDEGEREGGDEPAPPIALRTLASRLSAGLALPFAAFLAVAEVVRNWGDWGFWPFWLVDYIVVGLLIVGWRTSRNADARAPVLLAGAWGFACAMFYMSFFLHLSPIVATERGPIAPGVLAWGAGVLFAIAAIGFVSSMAVGAASSGRSTNE